MRIRSRCGKSAGRAWLGQPSATWLSAAPGWPVKETDAAGSGADGVAEADAMRDAPIKEKPTRKPMRMGFNTD